MPVHHLCESHGSSLPDLVGIQKFLEPYGRRKANLETTDATASNINCGTDYKTLQKWFSASAKKEGFPEIFRSWLQEDEKKRGVNDGGELEYVFVFHECKIPQDANLDILKLNLVGCSFHPKPFFEA